jgi:hypothetical protein
LDHGLDGLQQIDVNEDNNDNNVSETESNSESFIDKLTGLSTKRPLSPSKPENLEQDDRFDNNSEADNQSDSDFDCFNGKLSISKSKPPLPPPASTIQPTIGFKELPPRQSINNVKSDIEKRLESLSFERSRRIAKILRDN